MFNTRLQKMGPNLPPTPPGPSDPFRQLGLCAPKHSALSKGLARKGPLDPWPVGGKCSMCVFYEKCKGS